MHRLAQPGSKLLLHQGIQCAGCALQPARCVALAARAHGELIPIGQLQFVDALAALLHRGWVDEGP